MKSLLNSLALTLILSSLLQGSLAIQMSSNSKIGSKLKVRQDTDGSSGSSSSGDSSSCTSKMSSIFNNQTLSTEPFNTFKAYNELFCLNQPLEEPYGEMPSTCYYSGYFLLVYLQKVKDNPDGMSQYINDFCNTYKQDLPVRTSFVFQLMGLGHDAFNDECLNLLNTLEGINIWYAPIDPLPSISAQEVCDLHWTLFTNLHKKGINSLAEFTSFSYLIILDLYLNAYQQEDYTSCVNTQVRKDPYTYCVNFMHSSTNFGLKLQSDIDQTCILASQSVVEECDGVLYCDACGSLLAYIYQNFEDLVNVLYTQIYSQYSQKMYGSLDSENKKAKQKLEHS